jgi:hypothetical protein
MWELVSTTLLVKVEVTILKYGSPLHFLKSSVRRRKRSPHVRWLASPGGVGRRARACGTCVNGPAPRLAGERSPFVLDRTI